MVHGPTTTDGFEARFGASEREREARGTLYTPQEILRQPTTWVTTFRICSGRRNELRHFLQESGLGAGGQERERPMVYLVGAGTSDYIGRALISLLRRLWRCEVWAVPSTDLLTNFHDLVFPDRPYLWVSFSRSGDSSEGLAVLQAAIERYRNVRHVLVTCNPKGRMAAVCEKAPDRARALVLDDTANDRGLAMTNSYTNLVVAGQCLAHLFSFKDYEELFPTLLQAGTRFLERAQEAALSIAKRDFSSACFVGSGTLRAVAQESALKLTELTAGKIQAMSESALGLRHGPMSAVDADTLFVSLFSRDPQRRNYEMDLLEEIDKKRLGKARVAVAPDSSGALHRLADFLLDLETPNLADEYRAPLDVMLAQWLGVFCSLRLGLKPDCPSPDGVISRVVSHVKIYPEV